MENDLNFSPVGSLLELLPAFFHLVSRAVQRTEYDDRTRQLIKFACEFLCSDFREKKDIQEFCHTHGLGYENFRKKFAEIMGMPPNQYRMKRRHDTACALLMQRTLTIADIARIEADYVYREASLASPSYDTTVRRCYLNDHNRAVPFRATGLNGTDLAYFRRRGIELLRGSVGVARGAEPPVLRRDRASVAE